MLSRFADQIVFLPLVLKYGNQAKKEMRRIAAIANLTAGRQLSASCTRKPPFRSVEHSRRARYHRRCLNQSTLRHAQSSPSCRVRLTQVGTRCRHTIYAYIPKDHPVPSCSGERLANMKLRRSRAGAAHLQTRSYIVTMQAPPRPRLCWSPIRAFSTWRVPAVPRS